jgi:outer membrane biosynthesis protein TonB
VDVHPEVIDSVAAAARAWRYEPARRDGAPVPARVRVVVQLNGTSN